MARLLFFFICFRVNYGLLLPSTVSCTVNSTENACLLKRIVDLESQIKILNKKLLVQSSDCPKVAFMACAPNGGFNHVTNGQQIKCSNVQLNTGNAYKPFHGNFIAPATGTYLFTYTAATTPHSWIRISLKHNGSTIGQLLNTGLENYLKTTETVLVHLDLGDDVWLELGDISSGIDTSLSGNYETHFAGFLLHC